MANDVDAMAAEAARRVLADIDTRDLDHLDACYIHEELIYSLLTSSQPSNKQNILIRLLQADNHCGKSHPQLALQLILAMSSRPEIWSCLVIKTLRADCSPTAADRGNGILHEAALNARCHVLVDFIDRLNVNRNNRCSETALHLAAMVGSERDVRVLLDAGADAASRDGDGCTPLHSVAQSANPSCEVASMVLDALGENGQTENCLADKTGNSPLHVAAGNVNASAELIGVLFRFEQHRKLNHERDTPFHVAAKSDNPATLRDMLKCLTASRRAFSIDRLDAGREPDQLTLMELAAVAGNSEAVGLMIQNGADIGYRVLHTIVSESVRDQSKIDRLTAVYRAVVDNALHWRSVHERQKFPVGDRTYFQRKMQTVMYLLTRREDKPESRNVLEHAIALGAHRMLDTIVNTENVFRFSDNPFLCNSQTAGDDLLQYRGVWYVRDEIFDF